MIDRREDVVEPEPRSQEVVAAGPDGHDVGTHVQRCGQLLGGHVSGGLAAQSQVGVVAARVPLREEFGNEVGPTAQPVGPRRVRVADSFRE
ncbi:hypothetical protein N802_12430 [Knoellia sinensis KCTC 19936]|uniref:Uncharacterized protein n=1 Tax=Knoellia sinensis KCTC 19936 TaxID=1385520 RepID=A0A0A0JFL7_9MICO|nr:hypothetical protein [Knoellia sinensis]KGN34396.1 hypothetical protein N802_12430 [Knoellia sinensis KCTC 19936]